MTPDPSEAPLPDGFMPWAPLPFEPEPGPEPELGPYEPAVPLPPEETPPWAS